MNPIPPHPLLWQETKDHHGNSLFEAISMTYGDATGNASFMWRIRPVLRNNAVAWTIEDTDRELAPDEGFPEPITENDDFDGLTRAKHWCQDHEDELRAILGTGLLPYAEPEEPPLIGDDHGFAPTTRVSARWSRNEGSLRLYRVWKHPETQHEQEREIVDQPELDTAIGAYFRQMMIEEHVTRLSTGGYGRLIKETPFATCIMQAELDHIGISAFTLRIRGANPRDIHVVPPSTAQIMRCVAAQMARRETELQEKVGDRTERQLLDQIEQQCRALGLPFNRPSVPDGEGSAVLPVTIEDVQAGGGNVLDLGQKGGPKR